MMKWLPVAICALLLSACSGPSVVGKWDYQILGQTMVLDLREDKTFTMGSSSMSAQAGTYTVEDGKVHLNFGSSETENMSLDVSKDGRTLEGSIGIINITLKRQQS